MLTRDHIHDKYFGEGWLGRTRPEPISIERLMEMKDELIQSFPVSSEEEDVVLDFMKEYRRHRIAACDISSFSMLRGKCDRQRAGEILHHLYRKGKIEMIRARPAFYVHPCRKKT